MFGWLCCVHAADTFIAMSRVPIGFIQFAEYTLYRIDCVSRRSSRAHARVGRKTRGIDAKGLARRAKRVPICNDILQGNVRPGVRLRTTINKIQD